MSDTTTISDKQLAANRANAQKSTGPRTPEGRARSAQNARKHGFTASTFSVVRLEALDEVDRLKADLIAVYQPVNSQELFAIERIALAQHDLLRVSRLEVGLFTAALDETLAGELPFLALSQEMVGDIEVTRAQNRNFAIGEGFHRMARKSNCWSLFLRYQAQAERLYRRAIEEFERLKRLRPQLPQPDLPNEPIADPELETSEPLAANETNPSPSPDEPVEPLAGAVAETSPAPLGPAPCNQPFVIQEYTGVSEDRTSPAPD